MNRKTNGKRKSTALRIFKIFLGAVVVLIVGVFCVLQWPQIVINPTAIGWGSKILKKEMPDIQLNWTDLQTEVHGTSFTDKKVHIHYADLCFDDQKAIASCFHSLDFSFRYSLKNLLHPELTELGPTDISGGSVQLDFNHWLQAKRESTDTKTSKPMSLAWLQKTKLMPVHIDISKVEILSKPNQISAGLLLETHGTDLDLQMTAKALRVETVGRQLPGEIAHTTLHLKASDPTGTVMGPWATDGHLSAAIHQVGQVVADLRLAPDSQGVYEFGVQGQFSGHDINAHTQLSGTYEQTKVEANLSEDVRLKLNLKSEHLGAENCHFVYSQTSESQNAGKLLTHCPLFFEIPRQMFQGQSEISKAMKLGTKARVVVDSELSGPFPLNVKQAFNGPVTVTPENFLGPDVHLSGKIQTQLGVIPINLPHFEKVEAGIHLQLQMAQFEKLVAALAPTHFAIPAPFQTLHGALDFKTEGAVNLAGGKIQTDLSSHLLSPHGTQRIVLQSQGQFLLKAPQGRELAQVTALVDLLLSDVRLSLFPTQVAAPPQLSLDSRISEKIWKSTEKQLSAASAQAKASAVDLKYDFHLHTADAQSLQIQSSLTEKPVPISIDLRMSDPAKISGHLQIADLPLKILGEKKGKGPIRMDFATKQEHGINKGLITVHTNDHTLLLYPEELTGQVAGQTADTRTPPKFPVPIVPLGSAIVFGTPVNELNLQPSMQARAPETNERDREKSQVLKLRKRF